MTIEALRVESTTMTKKRTCYYIPINGYVEGEGYRVSIVTENEAGHSPSGVWPYDVRKPRPWFWGHDYEKAEAIARDANAQLGLSEREVLEIIASSMPAINDDVDEEAIALAGEVAKGHLERLGLNHSEVRMALRLLDEAEETNR